MCLRSITGAYKSVVALYVSAPRLLPLFVYNHPYTEYTYIQAAIKGTLWPGA